MKYLMNLSIDVNIDLYAYGLRGEGRWEYNTLNAFLSNNKQVHTTRNNVWKSSKPIPANLYDGLNESWVKESVLFVHGAGRSLFIQREDARAFIVQIYEVPYGAAYENFLKYRRQGRIVSTVSYYHPWIYGRMVSFFGVENVYCIPGAKIPHVVEDADNFRKPYVTWTYRNFKDFIEIYPKDIENLLTFLEQCMKTEPELRVAIIVGLWDTTRFGTIPGDGVIREWVLSFPVMQRFKHLFDRIDIYAGVSWGKMLDILSETRWIISPAEDFGASPWEAAMFGIPTIVNNGSNPFMALGRGTLFPEVLKSNRRIDGTFLSTLNKLQNDHSFYRRIGDAYRKYTRDNATFKVYVEQIDEIIAKRGWDK